MQQGPRHWVGRRYDRAAGTIEQGYRFTFVDIDGAPSGGFRSLAAAQQYADGGEIISSPKHGPIRPTLLAASALVAASASLAATAVTVFH